jgi:hypothetical protein
VHLQVDWPSLGLDPSKARIHAPQMNGMQDEHDWLASDAIPVEPGKGWMLILEDAR